MDIATFRAHKTKMLSKQAPAIRDTINNRHIIMNNFKIGDSVPHEAMLKKGEQNV